MQHYRPATLYQVTYCEDIPIRKEEDNSAILGRCSGPTHTDAPGKAHPGEDQVDSGNALAVRLHVRNVDGAADTVDVTAQGCARPALDFAIKSP